MLIKGHLCVVFLLFPVTSALACLYGSEGQEHIPGTFGGRLQHGHVTNYATDRMVQFEAGSVQAVNTLWY